MKYTVNEIDDIIKALSFIYEIVRLVDPVKHRMISFDEDENLIYDTYECYQVWKKNGRCQNCVSIKALHNGCRMTKFEFVEEEIYHVASKPITVIYADGGEITCTLEIVSKITDEILFGAFGKRELAQKIMDSEKKIYLDSLTNVYNRRYFDERIFCHNDRCDLENDVVFIMIDLKKFKRINDDYGHDTGDWVLKKTAQIIQSSVRASDSVIRLGGDEFLIVLSNAKEHVAERIMKTIEQKLKNDAVYDQEKQKYVVADFGIAGTDKFNDSLEFIGDLIKQADINMYKHKGTDGESQLKER